MNSNIIPRFCFSHSFWRLLFSPRLSNLIYFTSIPYFALRPLIYMGIMTIWSLFLFKKKLWLQSLNSSTAISQCLFPPMLSCLNELISMNNLYPGLLGTCFSFFFGMFACLIFACAHISHRSSFPVNFMPIFSAVVLRRCSPVCPVIWWNFQIGILFPGSITACARPTSLCVFIPLSHDDPDGIILSNFMLALVVLNSSIIKPHSFHLPFICHPSFMALVKLKRSWFSCGTILTSHLSLAIDPSLCLQITSNFPLCVQLMLLPFPIMTESLVGVSLYTPVLLFVMWLVAAESPIKMSFPMLESVISFETRA